MLTTAVVDGHKISIREFKKDSSKQAYCPFGHRIIAKKGKKVIHHFAHAAGEKCDPWRQGMTHWHGQWQKIVLEKENLEVCLDADGVIKGYSSFSGYSQSPANAVLLAQSQGHIADIICPSHGNSRPLVIEVQHSPMDSDTIAAREAYYQHMIWLFDITPRVVTAGNHNKIALVDGKLSYLLEKVSFVALLSSSSNWVGPSRSVDISSSNQSGPVHVPLQSFDQFEVVTASSNNNNLAELFSAAPKIHYTGDECMETELTRIGGLFVIINTRTKYWFDTGKPSYLDCGYGILRVLHKLDKGFALTLFISYSDFIRERMPPINKEVMDSCDWFKDISPVELIRLGIMPNVIDVGEIKICKKRVIINYAGSELAEMGMEKGLGEWHAGIFYKPNEKSMTTNLPFKSTSSASNDMLLNLMSQATGTPHVVTNAQPMSRDAIFIVKLRKFLGASTCTEIELTPNRGGEQDAMVYCSKETYGMKDKFKALGMKYHKVASKKRMGNRQAMKQTHGAIMSALANAHNANDMPAPRESKSPDKSYYTAPMKLLEAKLNQLMG